MRVLLVSLLFLLASPVANGEEFYGPLRIRDMGPFRILRLDMLPDHAVAPRPGRIAVEMHVSQSNTFAMDEDVHDYLETRANRREITAEDVANIRALSDDAFLFDGSLGYFQLTGHYGLSERWSAYVSVPAHYYGGGFMDSTIESFHDFFGFDSFGREHVVRDDFQAVAIVDGDAFVLLERPVASGFGDPIVGARYWHPLDERSAVTVELAHKLAVSSTNRGLSSGSSDTGLQVSWHRRGEASAYYAGATLVRAGRAEPFPDKTRRVVPSVNLAWERRLDSDVNFILQLNVSRSVFHEGDTELTANVVQASAGLRHRVGEIVWSYALTENLVNFNNTADLGFHIGFAWLPGS